MTSVDFFFFNDTATTEIYTLSLHDALPILVCEPFLQWVLQDDFGGDRPALERVGVQLVADVRPYELMKLRLLNGGQDRKSTRLNSSHANISYAVFCLKKKK